MRLKAYSDGASRGNPGKSAIAFKITTEDGRLLEMHSSYIGIRTNNQAEYEALISELNCALRLTNDRVSCYLDSELVVKQLNGGYKVKDPELKTLWCKVQVLKRKFKTVTFTHIPRTNPNIEEVDILVNSALDREKN